MNHHFRSYSEHQQSSHLTPSNSNGNSINANNNSAINNQNGTNPSMDITENRSSDGVVRYHSDSQQSLDRLFNLTGSQSTIPLRNRNLPASFFNPQSGIETPTNSFHNRSTSFDHRSHAGSSQASSIHMRTQSTLAPMTSAVISSATSNTNATPSQMDHKGENPTNSPMTNMQMPQNQSHLQMYPQQPVPRLQAPARTPISSHPNQNSAGNLQSPISQSTANQYWNYNQHTFNHNEATSNQTNYFYPNHSVNDKPAENPVTYAVEPTSPTVTMMDSPQTYTGQQVPDTNYQALAPSQSDYYGGQGSSHDLASPTAHPNQVDTFPNQNTFFASNDSPHQKFHITHSQPYVPYDSGSMSGSGLLNAPSQATSSSSSNENNSLFCIPTPAVHSRSCSFDGRTNIPITHSRSQSTIASMSGGSAFSNSNCFSANNNYPRTTCIANKNDPQGCSCFNCQ